MGFIKDLGSFAGKLAGGVVGGTVELVGEVTKSNFIKEVGQGVYKASSKSGELLGRMAEGTVDTVVGAISNDTKLANKGKKQFVDAASDTIKGTIYGTVNVVKKGIDTTSAILDGDKEKTVECVKDIVKIVAIGALSISVIEAIDCLDVIDFDDDIDSDFDDISNENPNLHHVTPHFRTYADGSQTWVDGDGDPSVDTGTGWVQHNPDYRSS